MAISLIDLDNILEGSKNLHKNFNKYCKDSLEHDKKFEELVKRIDRVGNMLVIRDTSFQTQIVYDPDLYKSFSASYFDELY